MLRLIVTVVLAGVLAYVPSAAPAQDEPVPHVLTSGALARVPTLLMRTPQQVYGVLGRPVRVDRNSLCCSVGRYNSTAIVHAYDVDGGGVVAFMYQHDKIDLTYRAVGIVFDNLTTNVFHQLADFFPQGAPAKPHQACLAKDFYHALDGERFQGVAATLAETTTGWTNSGAVFFTRFRTDGRVARSYDAVRGETVSRPLRNTSGLKLLQWGYCVAQGHIMDLHYGNNTDFSLEPSLSSCVTY